MVHSVVVTWTMHHNAISSLHYKPQMHRVVPAMNAILCYSTALFEWEKKVGNPGSSTQARKEEFKRSLKDNTR